MKIDKCGELESMWDYQKKQKKKIALLESLEKVASDGTGAHVDQEDTDPTGGTGRAESIEMTRTGRAESIEMTRWSGHNEAASPGQEKSGSPQLGVC